MVCQQLGSQGSRGAWKPARSKGASNVPGSKQGVRKAAMSQKASKELGSKQETRLLGSQQGIREPARHQIGRNESERQQ